MAHTHQELFFREQHLKVYRKLRNLRFRQKRHRITLRAYHESAASDLGIRNHRPPFDKTLDIGMSFNAAKETPLASIFPNNDI